MDPRFSLILVVMLLVGWYLALRFQVTRKAKKIQRAQPHFARGSSHFHTPSGGIPSIPG
jgi:hypothetical protein